MQDLTDLYQSVILDHNRRPRNYQVLPTANRVGSGNNPLCGDEITVYVKLDGDRIADISFQGSGCAISQASASLMTVNLKGKTVAEAEAIAGGVMKLITSGEVRDDEEISDLSALAGVHQFPARIKCATLSWHAALNAVRGEQNPVTTEKTSD
jgi:nitrogen fixation NifU-like protein